MPENPINKNVSIEWMETAYKNKMSAHSDINVKYLFRGHYDHAEVHRKIALSYRQKLEELQRFLSNRKN